MASKVFFSRSFDEISIREIFLKAAADMKDKIHKDDRLAIKVHFGEKGNSRFVSPENIMPVIAELRKVNSNHFLTDANTLYCGMRLNAKDHKKIALEHGFGKLGIDIIIADGELGDEESDIEVGQKHFKTVKVGKAISDCDAIVIISHFKGHMLFGFGGAIKNLGMGSGSRAGKLAMHSKISPHVIENKCIACGKCISHCAFDAIYFIEKDGKKVAHISDKCIGCAKCISTCPIGAVMIPWSGATSNEAQERCAEYALGTAKGKKELYITFINNITKDCDCAKDSKIIGDDVGIVASVDPVACDRAAYDLVKKAHAGKDIFQVKGGNPDGTHILDYSEKIGLGTEKYDLIEI